MRTGGIRAADIVKCNVRGQEFFARVEDKEDVRAKAIGAIRVEPLKPSFNIPTRFVKPRQITEHYSKRKG